MTEEQQTGLARLTDELAWVGARMENLRQLVICPLGAAVHPVHEADYRMLQKRHAKLMTEAEAMEAPE